MCSLGYATYTSKLLTNSNNESVQNHEAKWQPRNGQACIFECDLYTLTLSCLLAVP